MRNIIESIRVEYLRYKALAAAAIGQLSEAELSTSGPNGGNSIATICRHISGNFRSRFTEFLTSDGEKPLLPGHLSRARQNVRLKKLTNKTIGCIIQILC